MLTLEPCTAGVSYALADWTAQTCEGRGPFGFSRIRLLRCCFVGAVFLAPLAHSYYEFQDWLIPAALGLWGAPLKIILVGPVQVESSLTDSLKPPGFNAEPMK